MSVAVLPMNRLHGCHNSAPPLPTLTVQDGWTKEGQRITKEVEDNFSRGCKYDYKTTDKQCNGCRWR